MMKVDNEYKKKWYAKNKERLRIQEKSKEYHDWRNSRILLNKLIKKVSKQQKITKRYYHTFEQMYYLSKIVPLLSKRYKEQSKLNLWRCSG